MPAVTDRQAQKRIYNTISEVAELATAFDVRARKPNQ